MDAQVINEARAFLRNFRSVLYFADLVDQIGTWQDALTEVRISVKEKQEELAKTQSELDGLKSWVSDAKAEITKAKKAAKDIEAEARSAAKETMKAAEKDAALLLSQAADQQKAEEQKLAEIRQEIGKLSKQRDAALAELENTKKEHAALKERILNG